MKIKTGLAITLFFANMTRMLIGLLQMLSGLAAFALSATTSAFVIHHVFPNPYIPIAAGISLDLAKVTSIFMHRFSQEKKRSKVLLSFLWRTILVSVAALFTCIAVSGMLLNKNEGTILTKKKDQLTTQYQTMLAEEKDTFLSRRKALEEEKNKERVTGIGERYKQLEAEMKQLAGTYEERVMFLNNELAQKLSALETERFEGDRRKNELLFENFKETINKNFSVSTTYTGWILILVIAIALTLELTIYVTFDNMAGSILPYIRSLQEQAKVELRHRLDMHRNEMVYERRADDIITEGVIQEMEDAKNAKIIAEKFENFNRKAKKEMEGELSRAKKGFARSISESIKGFMTDLTDRGRKGREGSVN